ncbi:hypothetical protein [Mobilicoccus caccae]|uniref:Uncharacterized protein n=1 Tax=Mobilicoccus caccae TaxID=1859295 RepID=A0ABQ6ILW1_9MICO|nr:hypothetical protein [Mobilicoccus caccae]GMA38919.1 hypothetical protein GCM10025883_09640 [Mobilicoccus caccae]
MPEQEDRIRTRLAQLPTTPGWIEAVGAWGPPAEPLDALEAVVDAAVARYARGAHGQPTMLVHAATAPAAVARVLPHLPTSLHEQSVRAAWAATCAVVAAYRATGDLPDTALEGRTADDLWQAALAHGGEHVIKLADTALASAARTGNDDGLHATARALELDA